MGCCSQREERRSFPPSLADSLHPALETELTPQQLELDSSKGCALPVLENTVFQPNPPRTRGSTGELRFIETFWRGILLLGVSAESTRVSGEEEEEEEGKGEDQRLVGRGCAPLAAAEPRGLSERNRLKRRTWEFPQYFRPLKKQVLNLRFILFFL